MIIGTKPLGSYLDVAHETANLGSLIIFFSFVLVIGLGLMVHQMKSNTAMLNRLINNLTENNAAMLPQLAKLNESYERSAEILRQFSFNLEQSEENVFVLQQKVNTLREELFQLEKIISENKQLSEEFMRDSNQRFKEIDKNIVNILNTISQGKDDVDV